jgi:hypothetical protein
MDMTKFSAMDDPGFVAVTGEVRRWVKALVVLANVDLSVRERSEGGLAKQASHRPAASYRDICTAASHGDKFNVESYCSVAMKNGGEVSAVSGNRS